MMVRIQIGFDRKTLRPADRAARRRKISRGAFIRSAGRTFAEQSLRAAEKAALREQRTDSE